MSVLPAGSKLGRFQIASVLGQGAMGVVYLANDPDIERPVAERFDRMAYERLPAPADRTTGSVEFVIEPPDATVSESTRTLGAATNFGPASPLELKGGPAVHDLVLSAPGYKSKLVRILVAANAGKDRAKVRETLKRE